MFCRASRLVPHCGLSPLVTILRWRGTPGPLKVGRRRESVFKVTMGWPSERWRRTSVCREVKWWWTPKSWWKILSIKSRRWGQAWRETLLYNVLGGNGGIKHLGSRASLGHWRKLWWWSSEGHDIMGRWYRRKLLRRWLGALPLVLIRRVCGWRWTILLAVITLHRGRTTDRGMNMHGWRGSLHRRVA